uniref:Histone-lysine N-methyltransferase SETDB2 n=1 Tax=Pyxicephalus adspersus TaxID=30357 RepID=A0AAV3B3A5_PYXAD|nr:TPA: hypothetical protein GDO54_000350 [Pyxicephalus adspersus]
MECVTAKIISEEDVTNPDHDINDTALPSIIEHVSFLEHTCGEACLSEVNPYFKRDENPLRFPLMCLFHRWHAKSSLLSRPLDVIYKTPCGRSLRNFNDVRSYLFQTKCHFLFLDYFSFNTFLQLERNLVTDPVVVKEADISRDVELVPVSFCNEIDNTKPSPFTYRKSPWPRGYFINNFAELFNGCCDCTDGCLDVSTCTCLQLTARERNNNVSSSEQPNTTGYTYKRLQTPIPTGLYECNVSCKCDRSMCQNRVVQHGLQVRLQVYKTKEKGWGVRCLDDLDKGTFVCIYAGKLHLHKKLSSLQEKKSNFSSVKRPKTKTSILQKRGDTERTDEAGYLSDNSTLSVQSSESVIPKYACKQKAALQHPESEESICVLDASKEGNVARFLNHSCSPNLFVQPVFVETHLKKFPWVAFFTKSHIKAGTELTWNYKYNIGSIPEEEIPCLCGLKSCQNITI